MRAILRPLSLAALVGLLLAACSQQGTGPTRPTTSSEVRTDVSSQGPRRITAAINGNARTFSSKVDRAGSGSTPGSEELEELVNSGLSVMDARGTLQPLIAEQVPSLQNGLWVVHPDGRMETRWILRNGARWHDGTPITSDDLTFTMAVVRDPEVRAFSDISYDAIDDVTAPDGRSVRVTWKRPYIDAHSLFTRVRAQPLPKHLLEQAYAENKAGFLDLPYWTQGFVGSGPFRVRDWVAGSHVVLEANDGFVLGRPKLDELEVKFIQDGNALFANLLAGAVQLTMGRGLSIEQAAQLRDQWSDGSMQMGPLGNWVSIYPQFIDPSPTSFLNVEFRRAVLQAMDRQLMSDVLGAGLSSVADSLISPKDPEYPFVDQRIVRYAFDLRRATQMIEGLGYVKGPDGMFRDTTNQVLTFQAQGTTGATQERSMFTVVEYFQKLGIAIEVEFIQPQARTDRSHRAARSGIEVQRQTNGVGNLYRFHSSEVPLPENNFVGDNRARYRHPDLDAALNRYFTTVAQSDRMQALGDAIHHMTDQLNVIPLIFDGDPVLVGNRVRGLAIPQVGRAAVTWNAYEWTL